MKKIVMGIAAVAMAASMFAADVAGKLVYNTDIYNSKLILTAPVKAYDNNNTQLTFSSNGDTAGATFMLSNADTATFDGATSLWFKPVDAVKLTIGGIDTGSINRGTFAWWHRTVRVTSADAILLNTNIAGVGIEFATWNKTVETGNKHNEWVIDQTSGTLKEKEVKETKDIGLLDFNAEGYDILGNFYLNATYGLGDAGNLGFVVTKGADINAYGVGGWKGAGLAFCLSYDHMPWQTTGFYADVVANLTMNKWADNAFDEVGAQIGGQYVADGLALRLTAMLAYGEANQWDGKKESAFDYGFVAWASYNIEGWEPYVKVIANDISDKKFSVDAGVTKGFGAAAIDARFAGSYDGSAFSWSIPCTISCGL